MSTDAGYGIELGFYRGTSFVSRLIRWQTRSVYSHVAGRRLAGAGIDAAAADEGEPIIEAWHAPMPRGGVFVRRFWCEAHKPGTRVDVYLIPDLTADSARRAWEFAVDQIGKPYDLRAAIRFVPRWPQPKSSRGKWFCSELWAEAFSRAGLPLLSGVPSWAVSPGMLSWSPRLRYYYSIQGDPDGADRIWIDVDLARRYRRHLGGAHSTGSGPAAAPEAPAGDSASPQAPAGSSGDRAGTIQDTPVNLGTGNSAPALSPLGRLGHVRTYAADVPRCTGHYKLRCDHAATAFRESWDGNWYPVCDHCADYWRTVGRVAAAMPRASARGMSEAGPGSGTLPGGALGQRPKLALALCSLAAMALLAGCRTVGPVVRLERCARVTINILDNRVDAQQGKTFPLDVARGAQVPVGPGGTTALGTLANGVGGATPAESAVTLERPDVDAQPLQ